MLAEERSTLAPPSTRSTFPKLYIHKLGFYCLSGFIYPPRWLKWDIPILVSCNGVDSIFMYICITTRLRFRLAWGIYSGIKSGGPCSNNFTLSLSWPEGIEILLTVGNLHMIYNIWTLFVFLFKSRFKKNVHLDLNGELPLLQLTSLWSVNGIYSRT